MTKKYKLVIDFDLNKLLKKLPQKDKNHIVLFLRSLNNIENPYILGKKIIGKDDLYRYRVGKYRILAKIEKDKLIILVIDIAHRKDIYK